MIQTLKQLILKYQELIRYVIVGGITTAVNLGMYMLLTSTFLDPNKGWELQAANVISWIAAVTVAYILNRNVVFRSKNNVVWEMIQFYAARLATLGLEMGMTWFFVTILGWNDRLVKLMVQFVLVISNYLFSKLVIFRDRNKDKNKNLNKDQNKSEEKGEDYKRTEDSA